MAYWLFKQEPDDYGYADLERDGGTTWDGVANPVAAKHLRAVALGDEVFFYHTGKEKAVVGIMTIAAPPVTDGKPVAVRVEPLRRLTRPVTLAEIKADARFAGWELVRLPRLSVMPVPSEMWAWVLELAEA